MIVVPWLHPLENWKPEIETSTQKSKTLEMVSFPHFPSKILTAQLSVQYSSSHTEDANEHLEL
jgi:hypothetical protein